MSLSKVLCVGLAIIAVLVALGAEVLLVGFLLDLPVIGINQESVIQAPLPAMLWNIALLVLFAIPHSGMARAAVKKHITRVLPASLERSFYIFQSGCLLALLCHAWQPVPSVLWAVENQVVQGAIYAVFGTGLLILFWGIFSIDALHFHGVKQAAGDSGDPPFMVRGPYRWVRHPIQVGLIMALWATPVLTLGHLAFAGALTLYSVIATLKLEERDLRDAVGSPYARYAENVPALIPRITPWSLDRYR